MKIETKFDVGQEVYCMWYNIIVKRIVTNINIEVNKEGFITKYAVRDYKELFYESVIFGSIEELLESLKSDYEQRAK